MAGRPYPGAMHAVGIGALAAYTVWLLSFPMEGFLAAAAQDPFGLLCFLVPHASVLFACALAAPAGRIAALSALGGTVAAVATAAFPWAPAASRWLLFLAGASAAPVVLHVATLLRATSSPCRAAAWGAVGGNALLAGAVVLPAPGWAKALLLTLALLGAAWARPRGPDVPPEAAEPPLPTLAPYLPFILVFHLVSGLFYGRLMPAYAAVALAPGLELAFYAAAFLAAAYPGRGSTDRALALGIPLSLGSLVLLQWGTRTTVNLSMFAMQGAQGFMDAFLFFLLLRQAQPARAFGVGLGTLCLGIAAGHALAQWAGPAAGIITAMGNAALNLALLSLYFFHGGRHRPDLPRPALPLGAEALALPPGLAARLSAMERAVLRQVLAGKTYRETAQELSVSESSVKTYMKRLFDKAGVSNRGELLALLSSPPPS